MYTNFNSMNYHKEHTHETRNRTSSFLEAPLCSEDVHCPAFMVTTSFFFFVALALKMTSLIKWILVFFVFFFTALLKYNWYTKNCTYKMCTVGWVWACANSHNTISHHWGNWHTYHLPEFLCALFCFLVVRTRRKIYPLNSFPNT